MTHKASGSKSCTVAASQDPPPPHPSGEVGVKPVQKERRGFSDPLLLAGAPGSPLMAAGTPTGLGDVF